MSRLPLIQPQQATGETRQMLDAVQAQMGVVPNFLKVLANSPAALGAFLGMHGAIERGSLDASTRERIALAIAESNACQYCVSAHSAIGRKAGLDVDEILRNRRGASSDAKAAAALAFARSLNENRGDVSSEELDAVRAAGFGDEQIVEIIALVALNVFTNVLGKSAQVEIDFPRVALLDQSVHACPAC